MFRAIKFNMKHKNIIVCSCGQGWICTLHMDGKIGESRLQIRRHGPSHIIGHTFKSKTLYLDLIFIIICFFGQLVNYLLRVPRVVAGTSLPVPDDSGLLLLLPRYLKRTAATGERDRVCAHVCVCARVSDFVCMYVCVCMCICV
jgi:hypothetical protein